MVAIHDLTGQDPNWSKICLKDLYTGSCEGNSLPGGSSAISSVVPVFTSAFGSDLSELT